MLEVYGNTLGFSVAADEEGGSLITLISKYLSQCVDYQNGILLQQKTFEQLLTPIKADLHKQELGNQAK